jgi:hypothetical protein
MEATVCNREATCEGDSSFCFTPDISVCPAFERLDGDGGWAKACKCEILENGFHCNFASGFCEAGATPFTAPLQTCDGLVGQDSLGIVYGSSAYDSLCFISPLWKCANLGDSEKELCRSHLGWELHGD